MGKLLIMIMKIIWRFEELPAFPKDHLVMTTLLIDDRLNGLTRLP